LTPGLLRLRGVRLQEERRESHFRTSGRRLRIEGERGDAAEPDKDATLSRPGTDVIILKIFSPKHGRQIGENKGVF
jgi:hypothetical protein